MGILSTLFIASCIWELNISRHSVARLIWSRFPHFFIVFTFVKKGLPKTRVEHINFIVLSAKKWKYQSYFTNWLTSLSSLKLWSHWYIRLIDYMGSSTDVTFLSDNIIRMNFFLLRLPSEFFFFLFSHFFGWAKNKKKKEKRKLFASSWLRLYARSLMRVV